MIHLIIVAPWISSANVIRYDSVLNDQIDEAKFTEVYQTDCFNEEKAIDLNLFYFQCIPIDGNEFQIEKYPIDTVPRPSF